MTTYNIPHLGHISDRTGRWSFISQSDDNVRELRKLCLSQKILRNNGFPTRLFSEAELLKKQKCDRCGKPVNSNRNENVQNGCSYHTGKLHGKFYDCCGGIPVERGGRGCIHPAAHIILRNPLTFLSDGWQYHTNNTILQPNAINGQAARKTNIREAVAIDCEFGINKYNEQELIRISAIDFFTGQTLVDKLVYPNIGMKHCSTRWSGISFGALAAARRSRNCLLGRAAARKELLRFVGPDTVLITHGGSGDLKSLRLIHHNIVDTQLLSRVAPMVQGGRSLKNMCFVNLQIIVQNGKKGHDSVEDALATRELVWYYMRGATNFEENMVEVEDHSEVIPSDSTGVVDDLGCEFFGLNIGT